MRAFIESLGLAALAVFIPVKPILTTVLVLVVFDFITGVAVAAKQKLPVTSSGFKRTVGKLLVYEFAICLAFLVHQYLTGDLLPAEKLIAAMIGLTELSSVLENLNILNGAPVFASIIGKLTQAQDKDSPK